MVAEAIQPRGIDINTETLLRPKEATRHPAIRNANGKPAHIAKIYRLIQRGALAPDGTRQRLEYVRVPGGIRVSVEAIERLVVRLTNGGASSAAPVMTTAAQRRAQQATDRRLDRLGIG